MDGGHMWFQNSSTRPERAFCIAGVTVAVDHLPAQVINVDSFTLLAIHKPPVTLILDTQFVLKKVVHELSPMMC